MSGAGRTVTRAYTRQFPGPNICGERYRSGPQGPHAFLEFFAARRTTTPLVTDPSAVNESAARLHGLGRAVAPPALNIRARRDFTQMIGLSGMNLAGVLVIGCRAIGADA